MSDMKELYANDPGAVMMLEGIDQIIFDAKISALESILSESRFEGFATVSEFIKAIDNDIVLLNKMKIENGVK